MVVVIDNYDSFTYNLVQLIGELGALAVVRRNDEITVEDIAALNPSHIVISPGPGTPDSAGISCEVIRRFFQTVPILGVCLGHQCIGSVFGARIQRASRPMHGKTSFIHHDGQQLFRGLPDPLLATRYHSLIVREPLPPSLRVSAWAEEGEIMGVRHKTFPVEGVQFHPESILTEHGDLILRRFLDMKPHRGHVRAGPSPNVPLSRRGVAGQFQPKGSSDCALRRPRRSEK